MTTVLFVRHGLTAANTGGVLAGWTPGVHLARASVRAKFYPGFETVRAPGIVSVMTGAKGPNWAAVSACATSGNTVGEAWETHLGAR